MFKELIFARGNSCKSLASLSHDGQLSPVDLIYPSGLIAREYSPLPRKNQAGSILAKSLTSYSPIAKSKSEKSISSSFVKSPEPILTCLRSPPRLSIYIGTSRRIGQTAPIGTPVTFLTSAGFANSLLPPNNLLTFLKSTLSLPLKTSAKYLSLNSKATLTVDLTIKVLTISSGLTPTLITY